MSVENEEYFYPHGSALKYVIYILIFNYHIFFYDILSNNMIKNKAFV